MKNDKYARIFTQIQRHFFLAYPNLPMEQQPELNHFSEEEEKNVEQESTLPYIKEEKIALPKDYDATINRLTAQLQQTEDTSKEGKALFGVGLVLSAVLMITYLIDVFGFPKWLDWLHHILIFAEASIPFVVSFFLKKNNYATLMRLIGIIVLLVYLVTLFW